MAGSLTHRERIVAALSHEQPDEIPIDFGGSSVTSIVVDGYDRLKKHFGIQSRNSVMNMMTRIVHVDEHILEVLDIDTRNVTMWYPKIENEEDLYLDRYTDLWGVERVRSDHCYYFEELEFPLTGDVTIKDIANYPWPNPDDPNHTRGLREEVEWLKGNTDYAVVLNLPPPLVHPTQYLIGYEQWYKDLIRSPKIVEALFDAVFEVNLQIAKNVLREAGRDVDVIMCADDLGTQRGLQFSRELYVKFFKSRIEKYFQQIHDLSPAKLLFHTCGSVVDLIEDLIESGVDALNPIQVSAAGMNPAELNTKFGGRIAFWGGIDTQHILPRGTVKDVKKAVEDTIEQFGEGGGYVLSAVHNLQPDVPPENILAMFQHAREYVPSFSKS